MTCNTRNLSLSPVPRPSGAAWTRRLNGFTLVELLVVVVIISMLVGLLLPAVIGARASARKTECANNQKQLGTAILSYETAKKRLPGYANRVHNTPVSWVPVLFPFLGRMDLWEGATGWRMGSGSPHTPYIDLLVCPNDVTSTGMPQLTYVVNCGLYNDPTNAPLVMSSQGVFLDNSGGSAGAISLTDIKSPAQTILLSERVYDVHYPVLYPEKYWNTLTPTVANVGFLWPDPNVAAISGTLIGQNLMSVGVILPAPLPAIHPGVVIVTFCDGHVAEIVEDTPCNLYIGAP